ncbi:hypothetical protein COCC4DRAFT_61275 [Bipolaris maydis ATCC 48331]|uniref:Uncharacterized protein n=2 Tax=Cochliobolus heterostrophus TaxID=5016 RepID=M2UYZ3_COCH5|nr:uncharacterized protein COCC4DRAFT_61275 [Bipolaris maydis ATCC 48331]EMD92952.1 hypothetical protein COCHEDRAFT_1029192 [Bipolaris maydis C5]ENI04662.1 hypothetical protein COCC4DRAFT_61275 [Bipolaris maydis ATCC 48331]
MSTSPTPSSSSPSTPPPPRCPSCTSPLPPHHPSSAHELRTCDTCFVRLRCAESLWGSTRSEEITFFPPVLDEADLYTAGIETSGDAEEEMVQRGVEEEEEKEKRGLFAWVGRRR